MGRNEEADYKQAIEEAKNGNIPHSKNGLKNQVVALTVENKQITEENERFKKDNADLYKEYKDKEAKQMKYDKAIKAISLCQKQEPDAFARVFYENIVNIRYYVRVRKRRSTPIDAPKANCAVPRRDFVIKETAPTKEHSL